MLCSCRCARWPGSLFGCLSAGAGLDTGHHRLCHDQWWSGGLVCTTPLGALADHARNKRLLLGCSVALIVLGCGVLFLSNSAGIAVFSNILKGAAAAFIPPLLTGITLGMTGQGELASRLGINEVWSHAGNMTTAALGGLVGYALGIPGVFLIMAFMGLLCLYSLGRINPAHIDHAVARGSARDKDDRERVGGLRPLLANRALLVVGATLFFFHLVSASSRIVCGGQI